MPVRSASDKNQPAASRRTPGRQVRILLLDDVEGARKLIRMIIQVYWADAVIIECEDGDEAWKLVQASPPDLLITDLIHPGLRGGDLSQRLAEAHPKLPVLVVSARHEQLDVLRQHHQTNPQFPRGFLEKPFTVDALRAEIKRLIVDRAGGAQPMSAAPTCPHIVLADDENFVHEMVDLMLQETLSACTLAKSLDRDEAWTGLLREQPNLLITDRLSTNVPGRTEYFGMSGGELLQRLAERRVSYPCQGTSPSAGGRRMPSNLRVRI